MTNGWIKLYRQVEDNFLWLSEKFTKAQAWIDLVLNANHKDGKMCIRGIFIKIERGQIGWSELTMAKRWKWSKNKVRRFLKLLETEQQIEQQKLAKLTTIITILNYNKYQNDTTNDTTKGQQKDNKRYTNKKDKNVKNEKKDNIPQNFSKQFFNKEKPFNTLLEEFSTSLNIQREKLEEEFNHFILYWTEPNKSGSKVRWELQPTFDVKRRLYTWLKNKQTWSKTKSKEIIGL